jgi:hypothetical protein
MKRVYTAFKFGNYISGADDILNVTLENDMYQENIMGSKDIVEEKVVGVSTPYFFYIDEQPLEFEVNFAFEKKTKTQIKALIKTLISPKFYAPLIFGDYTNSAFIQKSPIYNVIFTGEPIISFIGANVEGVIKYQGYFTLNARCDRPYGYLSEALTTLTNTGTNHVNKGDLETRPYIEIQSAADLNNVVIKSWSNSNYTGTVLSQIGFSSLKNTELVKITGQLFTISSTITSPSIYSRWDKNNFILFSGNNYITVSHSSGSTNIVVKISYEAPLFIKDDDL